MADRDPERPSSAHELGARHFELAREAARRAGELADKMVAQAPPVETAPRFELVQAAARRTGGLADQMVARAVARQAQITRQAQIKGRPPVIRHRPVRRPVRSRATRRTRRARAPGRRAGGDEPHPASLGSAPQGGRGMTSVARLWRAFADSPAIAAERRRRWPRSEPLHDRPCCSCGEALGSVTAICLKRHRESREWTAAGVAECKRDVRASGNISLTDAAREPGDCCWGRA
jgi:hypothetical protein